MFDKHAVTFVTAAMFTLPLQAATPPTGSALWNDLKEKREALAGLHQEFEITQNLKTAKSNQGSKRTLLLDLAHTQWRQESVTGSGKFIRIFDGTAVLYMEEGSDEFLRTIHKPKDENPLPLPYSLNDPDWPKAKELERSPCKLPGVSHQCITVEVPLKPKMLPGSSRPNRRLQGVARILADLDNGMLLSLHTVESIESDKSAWVSDVSYELRRVNYAPSPSPNLLSLPSTAIREVKELTHWNAARLKKQLAGKPAPELAATDIHGNPVSLAGLKGKTVLLDFWTTWCPPCRADAPALDKLYSKYAQHDLAIIGVSVSEDRPVVEKFLAEHPHTFPVLLTTENDMPRPYQIGVFPTYIVIEKDGTIGAAVEGDQGFSELHHLLKKAGLELE